jgi:hypothetical protein
MENKEKKPLTYMNRTLLWLLFSALILPLHAQGDTESYTRVGQPTIFWRFGEWQTLQDGKWVPYAASAKSAVVDAEPAAAPEPAVVPEPEATQTNVYVPGYGWGFGFAGAGHRRHEQGRGHVKLERRKPDGGFDRPIGGLGRTTIGIGRPNVGIGQTTIGIGQPNVGIGQTTIGIGRQSSGIGQTTIGIGRPMGFSSQHVGSRDSSFGGSSR